jgi:hypothetical protein
VLRRVSFSVFLCEKEGTGMINGDVWFGWVDDATGQVVLYDMYAYAQQPPTMGIHMHTTCSCAERITADTIQNLYNISGSQNATHTTYESRPEQEMNDEARCVCVQSLLLPLPPNERHPHG